MISIHDSTALRQFFIDHSIDLHILRRFRTAFYKKSRSTKECIKELPADKRTLFTTHIKTNFLTLEKRRDSQIDGCSKLAFRTESGHLIETVILRIDSGRTSLCISSQVGCAAKCAFCATGQMQGVTNLSYNEILDQIICANDILRPEERIVRNIVFMGMGEPLHNYTNLSKALNILKSDQHFKHTTKRIIVSTVGVCNMMKRFNSDHPDIGLALSLHSARQEIRQRIMPWAKKCTLPELRATLTEISSVRKTPIMLEYLLLKDLTDRTEDLHALLNFCQGLPVHINLIPYNSNPQTPTFCASPKKRMDYFSQTLKDAGLKTTLRYSLGNDIEAACGQLV